MFVLSFLGEASILQFDFLSRKPPSSAYELWSRSRPRSMWENLHPHGLFVGITWDFLHRGHGRIVGCNEVIGRNNPIVITLTGSDEIRVKRDAVFDEDKEMKVAGCLVVPVMLGSASSYPSRCFLWTDWAQKDVKLENKAEWLKEFGKEHVGIIFQLGSHLNSCLFTFFDWYSIVVN